MTSNDAGVQLLGVRFLEGPNLYFTRPTVRVTADLAAWYAVDAERFEQAVQTLGGRAGRTGQPGDVRRARAVIRLVELATRRIAAASGTPRLGVRVREGADVHEVILAFPASRPERGKELGRAVVKALGGLLKDPGLDPVPNAASRIVAVGDEPRFALKRPKVPVIAITGTNGKTTTTRLVAHIAMCAEKKTAWSSTDGVLVMGKHVEQGDYSGPGGARAVLETPGLEVAVLETARGGLLNRGMGVPVTDVSVVTNVTPDHLGVGGIETVDQLAEVKAIITKVVKPSGWVVLNGDDPRVWAMRTGSAARPICFTLDPHSPAIREARAAHGKAFTIVDGWIVRIDENGTDPIVSLDDVPMTLAGLSVHNVANALAGAAGALALGLPRVAVVEGLKTFAPDASHNPGRMNVYTLPVDGGAATVIIDMAHNEGGLEALLAVARGLVAPQSKLVLGLGTGGDRTDEILTSMGEMAGLGADCVHIVHKDYYLRGRTRENLEGFLRAGLAKAGVYPGESSPDELVGFPKTLEMTRPGDVLAFMTHSHQREIHTWLMEHGAAMDDAAAIRTKAQRHRQGGEDEHELTAAALIEQAIRLLEQAKSLDDAPKNIDQAIASLLED